MNGEGMWGDSPELEFRQIDKDPCGARVKSVEKTVKFGIGVHTTHLNPFSSPTPKRRRRTNTKRVAETRTTAGLGGTLQDNPEDFSSGAGQKRTKGSVGTKIGAKTAVLGMPGSMGEKWRGGVGEILSREEAEKKGQTSTLRGAALMNEGNMLHEELRESVMTLNLEISGWRVAAVGLHRPHSGASGEGRTHIETKKKSKVVIARGHGAPQGLRDQKIVTELFLDGRRRQASTWVMPVTRRNEYSNKRAQASVPAM
ncbi:hypothetical protein C8J57DRAFT_1240884 [Mycena rebaudengoi]|nr:hypothetical protein C8J57DRAFT_1240884 [Mycena rebaudengoi]